MQFVKIEDPDKPGDYLVVASRDFDPSKHRLFIAGAGAAVLRQDGPTFEEFLAAGHKPEAYPPAGYAEKPSAALEAFRKTGELPKGKVDTTPGPIATVNSEAALDLIASVKKVEDLDVLEKDEKASEKHPGGRKGVLTAIADRRKELAG
jgi:hypothetical protein